MTDETYTEEEFRISKLVFNTIGDTFLDELRPVIREGFDPITLIGTTTYKTVRKLYDQGLIAGLEHFKLDD